MSWVQRKMYIPFLGADNWREIFQRFVDAGTVSFANVQAAADGTITGTQASAAAMNAAERELVDAASAVEESRKRLDRFKTVAVEKQRTIGEGYIGCEIIDISAPILNNAANLIEATQKQTKFLLAKNPKLPNQSGLVKTAGGLVDSLDLILVAAEATVNHQPDAIAKVLASCNLISRAVAHFLAECHQKGGSPELNQVMTGIVDSIQGMIKQLRAFGEKADMEKREKDEAANRGKGGNLIIVRLNLESRIARLRKELQEAEARLRKLRQTNR
jgi:hypothetical protein